MMRAIIFLITCVILDTGCYGKLSGDCSPQAGIPCLLHKFTKDECFSGNLNTQFPFYETNTTEFPGKPGSFDADSGYRFHPSYNQYFPELNLTFTTPQNAGKNYVKGFEVMRYDASNTLACYILDLSNVTWDKYSMTEMNIKFRLDLFPLNPNNEQIYVFELYALPKQENKDVKYDQYLPLYVQFPSYNEVNDPTPRNWKASISYYQDSEHGNLNVSIAPPPDVFNFTLFEYSLVIPPSLTPYKTQNSENTWYQFTRVPSGTYYIMVKPVTDRGICPCKDISGQICDHCLSTKTRDFNFTYTGMSPITSSPPVEEVTSGAGMSPITTPRITPSTGVTDSETVSKGKTGLSEESNEISDIQVAMAVFGTIVGIALVVAAVIYNRKCRYSKEEKITPPDKPGLDKPPVLPGANAGYIDDITSIMTFQQNPVEGINNMNAEKLKFKKIPKLCLLYEEDHMYHRNVVLNFANYLQQHCQCVPMCVEWQLDAPWVHEDIEQADYVVIVNSEGAYKSYMAKYGQREGTAGQFMSSSTTRRMSSINSIRNKFLHDERYDNIVMVYFDYTDENYILPDICPGYKYRIPKHFNEFLLHIHKLHRTDDLSRYDLPFEGNHSKHQTRQELLESITAADRYQKENPNWLQNRSYDRMWSQNSDESKLDSGIALDFPSPGNTPQTERDSPFRTSSEERGYHDLLENRSVLTVYPSDIGLSLQKQSQYISQQDSDVSKVPKNRPKLSPQSFIQAPQTMLSHENHSPPTCSTVEDEFVFFPPEDLDENFDILSKTQSEQMKSIVDRYQAINSYQTNNSAGSPNHAYENVDEARNQSERYDRNIDLHLLKVQSGEIPFVACNNNYDVVSLGGESV